MVDDDDDGDHDHDATIADDAGAFFFGLFFPFFLWTSNTSTLFWLILIYKYIQIENGCLSKVTWRSALSMATRIG